jgi:DNA-binding transcriptional LysR family regulator
VLVENTVSLLYYCAKMHNVNWDDLRFFLAVHRAGTTSGAARELRVEHTTVGRRLAALEEALGATLFLRTKSGTAPTAAAAAILPLAEAMENDALAIERRIGASDAAVSGIVRLTTSEAFGGYLIRKLPALQERHPRLVIEIHTGNEVLDLTRGGADVAVRFAPTPQRELICRRVGEMAWALLASPDYLSRRPKLVSLDDLTGHDVIGYDERLQNSPGGRWIRAHAQGAKIPVVATSLVAAVDAAAAGIGMAVAPLFLAADRPAIQRVWERPLSAHPVWVVYHPDVGRLARVRAVADFVAKVVKADRVRFSGSPPS